MTETTDLQRFLTAASAPYEQVAEIAEETGSEGEAGWVPAYGKLLNPSTCPAKYLPWLGQFAGVEVPKTMTGAEARELVMHEPGLERGTRQAVEGAIRRIIGKTEPFMIQERTEANGSEGAYHFNVLVKPGKSSTALKQAIEEQKPGGVMFSIIEVKDAWITGAKKWSEISAGRKWTELTEGTF
jgi:P2-related tail formation protein